MTAATYGLCQLCSQLCPVCPAPLGTMLDTGRPLAAHSPKRETYKRIIGKKTLSGIRGLALDHTRACRLSHSIILAVTLCYILQNVTIGGNQGTLYSLSQLHGILVISTKIQLNKTP